MIRKIDDIKSAIKLKALIGVVSMHQYIIDIVSGSNEFLFKEEKKDIEKLIEEKNSNTILKMSTVTTKIIELFNSQIEALSITILAQQEKINSIQMYDNMWSLYINIDEEKDFITIDENLIVIKALTDPEKYPRQNSTFQLFLDGILQVNDYIENGDYSLAQNKDGSLLVKFYENIQPGSSITIFAIKS
jgi:hypothetical protein